MKRLIDLIIIAIISLTLASCQEKRWQESELTKTEVLKASISSSSRENLYIYPEHNFIICERNVNLDKYEMTEYSYTEENEDQSITFKATLSQSEYAAYEIRFSSATNSGRLTTKYFENGVELIDQMSVESLSSLEASTQYIDLN